MLHSSRRGFRSLVWFLLLGGSAVGQNALDGFCPNVNGVVNAVALQADGRILLGGRFTQVGGIIRSNLARLNLDGSVDEMFNPGPDQTVWVIAVQPDGRILLGGEFEVLDMQARRHVGRLNDDGSLDADFDPSADGAVHAIAVQQDGKVLLGGEFETVRGSPRANLARLLAGGSVDVGFAPGADGNVRTIVVQPDGRIIVGGSFSTLAGEARSALGRLNSDGSLDTAFEPRPNSTVTGLALQADGRIVIVGLFQSLGVWPRQGIGRLNRDGTVDANFDAAADGAIYSVVVEQDGLILVGGDFTRLNEQPRHHVGRLTVDGHLDGFNPDAGGLAPGVSRAVSCIGVQRDGKILVGGEFTTLSGTARQHVGRLYPDGRLDRTLETAVGPLEAFPFVNAYALQPDGKILLGGNFFSLDGQPRVRLGRLNTDGSVDTTFVPPSGTECCVLGLAALADGKILVTGYFTNLVGQLRPAIGRLHEDGSLDDSFRSPIRGWARAFALQPDGRILLGGYLVLPDGSNTAYLRLEADGSLDPSFHAGTTASSVDCLAVQPDGKILIQGMFTWPGQLSGHWFGRLLEDGSRDTEFNPEVTWINCSRCAWVNSIAIQAEGKILLGGFFTGLNGPRRWSIGRLNANGTLDTSFDAGEIHPRPDPLVASEIRGLSVQTDGKILIGGNFTTIQGQPRNLIARLHANGSLDLDFRPEAGGSPGGNFYPDVYSPIPETDGKVLVSGVFTNLGGEPRNYLGRLAAVGATFQSLAVDEAGGVVTWSRSGTGPEVDRAYFEQSTDGTNYWFLGAATRIPGGWQLGQLALPLGEAFYVRARGRVVAGILNNSSSLVESVARFWRLPPPFISSVQMRPGGVMQFSFANTNAVALSVLTSSDVAASLESWENLGSPSSLGDGIYQFVDADASKHPRRFYRLRTP